MSRARRRWATFARAAARRLVARTRQVLFTDPGQEEQDDAEIAGARTLARHAGELKGGMAKVAQLMAYQRGPGAAADAEARRALGTLWDRAPEADRTAIRAVVTEDLGRPPEELFATWDDTPLAAASLGQVHAATGRDGVRYAVKVQYPGIAEGLASDLRSPRVVRKLAGAELGGALSSAATQVLCAAVLGELDYVAEGRWLARFGQAFAGDPGVLIPRFVPELSSRRVLTATRLDGQCVTDLDDHELTAEDRRRAALAIFRFAWGGPLRHGLLNADPNPGNYLLVRGDAGPLRVGFVDFGCSTELGEDLVATDRKLWRAMLEGDGEALRFQVHAEGLISRARMRTFDSGTFRDWERHLAAPFLARREFAWTPVYARALTELTSQLVPAGGMTLPPGVLLLWRQRLGVAAVLASLGATGNFADELARIIGE